MGWKGFQNPGGWWEKITSTANLYLEQLEKAWKWKGKQDKISS